MTAAIIGHLQSFKAIVTRNSAKITGLFPKPADTEMVTVQGVHRSSTDRGDIPFPPLGTARLENPAYRTFVVPVNGYAKFFMPSRADDQGPKGLILLEIPVMLIRRKYCLQGKLGGKWHPLHGPAACSADR